MRDLFERGGLFSLPKTMVSVLHKELEYKVETQQKKVGGPQPRIRIKSELPVGELTILNQSTQSFTAVTDYVIQSDIIIY